VTHTVWVSVAITQTQIFGLDCMNATCLLISKNC